LPRVYKKTDDVKPRDLSEIYHISDEVCGENKRKINCKLNPNCFLGLGESKLGEAIKAQIDKDEGAGVYLREPNTYVGLKNLGATCYMNTLLQALFMNKTFRQGVYDWEEDQKDPNAICYQLQMLFGFLQEGKKTFYDPTPFANEINIKTGEQQDAQEFYKIFVSYLEEEFKKSPIPRVHHLIEQQFQGKSQYITICQNCHTESIRDSSFYELELGIDDILTIEESIGKYLGEEDLNGSNQYLCEVCAGKQDATRFIALKELPEVLSLQLLRFYYDIQSGSKKKKSNVIYFPTVLDMKKFVREPNLPDEEYIYTLTSMLIHIGNSAYGGHYVADIRDEETNKWYRFDDEVVEEIDLHLEPSIEDQKKDKKEDKKVAPKSPKKQTGKPAANKKEKDDNSQSGEEKSKSKSKSNTNRGKNDKTVLDITEENDTNEFKEGFVSSNSAYFLTYTRKGRKTVAQPTVPENLKAIIELQSNEFELEAEQDRTKRNQVIENKTGHQKMFEKLWKDIAVMDPSVSSKCYWISLDWLKSWIKGECEVQEKPIDNTSLVCRHEKLDPRKLASAKRINPDVWDVLYEKYKGGPELTQESYCKQCIVDMSNYVKASEDKANTKQEILDMIANSEPKSGYWLSLDFIKEFKKAKPKDPETALVNQDIQCPHLGLTFESEKNRKIVSSEVWSYITSQYPNHVEMTSHDQNDTCIICQEDAATMKQSLKKETARREKLKKELPILFKSTPAIDGKNEALKPKRLVLPLADEDEGETYYVIPLHWAERWRYYVSHVKEEGLQEPEECDNTAFLCEHAKFTYNFDDYIDNMNNTSIMLIVEEEWNSLKDRFGGGPDITTLTEVCEPCREKRLLEWSEGCVYVMKVTKLQALSTLQTGSSRPRGRKKIEGVTSQTTVQKLKMLICEDLDLLPSEQELHYQDIILVDPKKTLAEYGVKNDSVIQALKVDGSVNDDIAMRDNAKEEGFLGSTLLGGKRKRDDGSRSEETSRSENTAQWKCDACTLINAADENSCAACTTARPSNDNEIKRKRSRSESGIESESEDDQRLVKRQRVNPPSESNNNNNDNQDEVVDPALDVDAKPLSRSFGSLLRKASEFLSLTGSVEKPVPQIKLTRPPSPTKSKVAKSEDNDSLFEEFQIGSPSNGHKN
jgi:ubiquitin carboxyl-terminal hydrolase 48